MKKTILATLTVLTILALPGGAVAQQAEEAKSAAGGVKSRFIGDWAYVPVTAVPGPFVTTFASSTTALGGHELDLSFPLLRELNLKTENLTYIGLLQRFDAQLAFLRRFGVRATLQGEGVIPDTGTSALSLAINGTWVAGGGLVAKVFENQMLILSLTADYRRLQQTIVSPAASIQPTDGIPRLNELFTRQDVDRVLAGGSVAVAFTDWIGAVGEAQWEGEWQEATGALSEVPADLQFVDLSAAVSANTWGQKIPVALTGFWRERIPVGGENVYEFSRQYGGGVFYTGRPYLDVGVEVFAEDQEQKPGNVVLRAQRFYIAPRLRGYF